MNMQAPISPAATPFAVPRSRWDDREADGKSPNELLLYRSNLLGSDLTVTNFGGGNTSAKLTDTDPLTGEAVEVLWVKGSGGDLGSMKLDGFATLYQDKLLSLKQHYGGPEDDDKMVGYLPHCTFGLNPRAASIDTPLHALLPFAHIDHVHPDAIIALAASSGGGAATREIWGGRIGWLGWKRPGYTLGIELSRYVAAHPAIEGVVLAGHGIICWGDTSKDCYEHTIALIAEAAAYLNARLAAGVFWRCVRLFFPSPPRHCGRAHAAAALADDRGPTKGRPLERRRGDDRVRELGGFRAAGCGRHLVPRSFPSH
jgi:rhamnose utilization protein RhaD (predicted bifunctional aldolase and dehydrogenase)